jgi:hypothetical protein
MMASRTAASIIWGLLLVLLLIGVTRPPIPNSMPGDSALDSAGFGWLSGGMFSAGVLSAGLFSVGIFSAGLFSVGIFSAGLFSLGVVSIGTFAVGIWATGQFVLRWGAKKS